MRYNKQEQIKYQSHKLKYHFERLRKLGLSKPQIIALLNTHGKS